MKTYPINYVFIDSQNLNLGTGKDIYKNNKLVYKGWRLDFKKFKIYLSNKFHAQKAFLCIGYIKENEWLYSQLKKYGYTLIFKPTTKDSQGKPKGNVDAELVLNAAAIEYPKYDKAIIVSGDGDFYCLHSYLVEHNKLLSIIIPNKYNESRLLSSFQKYKVFLFREKDCLETK